MFYGYACYQFTTETRRRTGRADHGLAFNVPGLWTPDSKLFTIEYMHIFFSGLGGTGIGPLALISKQAGFDVSGSDKQDSPYFQHVKAHGVDGAYVGQTANAIAALHARKPIDWFVYSSSLPKENPRHPELEYVRANHIRNSKRDEFLNYLLTVKNLDLVAVAGTHGKTTTTAMVVWLCKQLGLPVSYSVGAKLNFGEMGEYHQDSRHFVYECDEYDRNFLSFHPALSLITGIDWDHADVFPTRDTYQAAFRQFLSQSQRAIVWRDDAAVLHLKADTTHEVLDTESQDIARITLPGEVNRRDGWQAVRALHAITGRPEEELVSKMNGFPGLSRRFEQIVPGLHSDYAHTPPKIRGALQLAHEVAGDNVVVVYEGLHNTRQHFIKRELATLFGGVKKLYVVPSYLAREDPRLPLLSPADIVGLMHKADHAAPANLDADLKQTIQAHLSAGDTVLCLTAGGGGSLDEWLRKEFAE